jgi:bifunctional oligoribonuclease and PAP phosphatase NrnA
MQDLAKITQCIEESRSILISGHFNPDGDSIGSLLGLGLGLRQLGKKVYMISADDIPKRYRKLPGASKVVKRVDIAVDAAIAVDCGSKELLGETFKSFLKAKKIIEIDHHQFRKPFGHIRLVDRRAAAVGELIYLVLENLGVTIGADIAKCLLTSIIVETNSFRLPSTNSRTFSLSASLMDKGINFYHLTEMVYWSKSRASLILSGICLGRTKFLKHQRIAYSSVTGADFKKTGACDEDVDAVASDMLSIEGVRVAIFFREKTKKFLRVSLRSKGKINIARVAEQFGGGGHFDSAGCYIDNTAKAISGLLAAAKKAV